MNLRTGASVWALSPFERPRFEMAQGDLACEVAVIGGGITGALVSLLLVREGVDTLLVDKGDPAGGSTAASTGLLQYEVDTQLCDLIGKVGEPRAVHAYRRGLTAIDELEELLTLIGSDCGFSRRGSLYFASQESDESSLWREFECRRHFGFDVRWLSRDQLADVTSIAARGAILSQGDAQIDPLNFTRRLLEAGLARGLRAYRHSAVEAWDERNDGVFLQTPEARIRARAVVVATGYEAHRQLESSPGNLQSTYAVASEPHGSYPDWPDGWLIWETARPYFYARQTSDGRALIGGGDTDLWDDHADPRLLERQASLLCDRFGKLFPHSPFQPDCAWAGTFAETKDGLAYIGRVPRRHHIFAALGYGGNGITFSAIAARLLCDLFLGRPNSDAEVFSFGR